MVDTVLLQTSSADRNHCSGPSWDADPESVILEEEEVVAP